VDFFAGAHALKAGIAIPTPKLQRRLLELIEKDGHLELHNPRYSVLSNPFDARYQNCAEYVLDMINAVLYQTMDKEQLKVNARAYFQPYSVKMSGFNGCMFMTSLL